MSHVSHVTLTIVSRRRKCLESYSERNAMDTERLCFDGSRFNNDHDEQSHQEINSEPFCGLPNFRFVYKVPITQEVHQPTSVSYLCRRAMGLGRFLLIKEMTLFSSPKPSHQIVLPRNTAYLRF